MQNRDALGDFMSGGKWLTSNNRLIRLKLFHRNGLSDDVLLPQYVRGTEAVCSGFEYQIDCVATSHNLPLKEFIGIPASLEFVTDRGQLRKVNGLVAQAASGDSDGTITSYQLVLRDAMTFMEHRVDSRIFRQLS